MARPEAAALQFRVARGTGGRVAQHPRARTRQHRSGRYWDMLCPGTRGFARRCRSDGAVPQHVVRTKALLACDKAMASAGVPSVPLPATFLFDSNSTFGSVSQNVTQSPSGRHARAGQQQQQAQPHDGAPAAVTSLAGCSLEFLLRPNSSEGREQALELHLSQLRASLVELSEIHRHADAQARPRSPRRLTRSLRPRVASMTDALPCAEGRGARRCCAAAAGHCHIAARPRHRPGHRIARASLA